MSNDPIVLQLKRIKGQLEGVITMYENDQACVDVVRQVVAARNSLGRVARDLLTNEASRCHKERKVEELEEVLKELFRY
ncbi:metal-sensitive transcriptional regulator [Patescibacteria group bacterium]|nr:metal-sensitive transcriptional regulator [Patescibacteria group bacterium]